MELKILSFSQFWGLPWWKEHVTDQLPNMQGQDTRKIIWYKMKHQKNYDVVCIGGSENILFTFYLNIFGKKTGIVMGEMFLPEPNPKSWMWQLKRKIRQFLFRNIDRFVVYSTAERKLWADYLGYDISRFKTILFASNILAPAREPEGLYLPEGNYGFAAGSSERDFKTFFEAVKEIPYPFVTVANKS